MAIQRSLLNSQATMLVVILIGLSTNSYGADQEKRKESSQLRNSSGLLFATSTGNAEAVSIFLRAGADKDASDPKGLTPLARAVYNGHEHIVEILLQAGADPNKETLDGKTPLRLAVDRGNLPIAERLLKGGADPNRAMPTNGMTPLFAACFLHRADIAELLIRSGATVDQATTDKITPLWWSAYQGYSNLVDLLIKAKANITQVPTNGKTPLLVAAERGHANVIKSIIAAGADLDKPNPFYGTTPLWSASFNGNRDCVELLVSAGAQVDKPDFNNLTPLFAATNKGHAQIAELLLHNNASLEKSEYSTFAGATLLAQALRSIPPFPYELINSIASKTVEKEGVPRCAMLTFTALDDTGAIAREAISEAVANNILIIGNAQLLKNIFKSLPRLDDLFSSGQLHLFLNKKEKTSPTTSVEHSLFVMLPHLQNAHIQHADSSIIGHPDGLKNLEYIQPTDIHTVTIHETTPDALIDTFRDIVDTKVHLQQIKQSHPTKFFFVGHGNAGIIADLPLDVIPHLFKTLEDIHTDFLYLSTCNVAGNNLLQLPKSSFPVVIQASSDVATFGVPWLQTLFLDINRHETRIGEPDILQAIAKKAFPHNPNSIASVRYPGASAQFRPIADSSMEIMTAQSLRIAGWTSKHITRNIQPTTRYIITFVRDMRKIHIDLSPGAQPKFISKIPGTAQHFIGKLTFHAKETSLPAAIYNFVNQSFIQVFDSSGRKTLTTKCWFIQEVDVIIMNKKHTIKNLIINLGHNREPEYCCEYKGIYNFFSAGQSPIAGDEKTIDNWYRDSIPSEAALYEASGGLESIADINWRN